MNGRPPRPRGSLPPEGARPCLVPQGFPTVGAARRKGRRLRALVLAAALAGAAAGSAQTTEPVRISDATGSSVALRAEFRSLPNQDLWPDSRTLVPLYDAWEIGVASLYGEVPLRLAAGQRFVYDEGQVSGPANVATESALSMVHAAKKWTGGLPNGDELDGFLGIGAVRLQLLADAGGANFVEAERRAVGMVLGFGYRHDLPARTTLEARLGVFSGNPLYFFGRHDFASGLTSEAVFGELGFVWPRGQTVALHAGIQGIRYVPRRQAAESLTDLRLWGPFLGIQAALR